MGKNKSNYKKLEWNVYAWDTNNDTCEIVNIFHLNWLVLAHLYTLKNMNNKKKFEEELDGWLKHEYWSRSQYEVSICQNFPMTNEDTLIQVLNEIIEWNSPFVNAYIPHNKIDIYQQLKLNWPQFLDYCWNNRKEFAQFKEQFDRNEDLNSYYRKLFNEKYGK